MTVRLVFTLLALASFGGRAAAGQDLALAPTLPAGGLTISAGSVPVRIQRRLTIQRQTTQGWTDTDLRFEAISQCIPLTEPPPPCVTVEPGQPIVIVPWTGQLCRDQCGGDCKNIMISRGTYRYVAKACETGLAFPSAAFPVGPAISAPHPAPPSRRPVP